jgi:hypothetical protein
MAVGGRRSSMRIRKCLVVCFAALLAGIGLASPTTAGAASIPLTCGTQKGGSDRVYNPIKAVRVGSHPVDGYDRFVVEFANQAAGLPFWTATPKSSALFYQESGQGFRPVQLEGNAGIKLSMFSTSLHDPAPVEPDDFNPTFPQLTEVRDIGDFEGHVTFGLGLVNQSCKRIQVFNSPLRLVIDVPTS